MDAPEPHLSEAELLRFDLGEGCGIGGVLINEHLWWIAWTPAGVMNRLFASRWTAIAAVAHFMRLEWSELTAARLLSLERIFQGQTFRIAATKRSVSDHDPRVQCWKLAVGKRAIYLHEVAGSGFETGISHSLEEALTIGAYLLSELQSRDPAPGASGTVGP